MGQQGNPLQQQHYTQEMLQQSLTAASAHTVQELNDPNSIPASGQYSIPSDNQHQQQVQTMQVYSDQQMATSHSMSEHDPNSMSMGDLHSIAPPDLIPDTQQLAMPVVQPPNSDTVMMQDIGHMTQYTNYSMQDPMNTTIYGTETVSAPIQQTSVMAQSLGTQYQVPMGLNDNVTQSVTQNSNVYASVASYDMDMQSQEAVGMVNYTNSQQNMMVQTQSDMMGDFTVVHNGLLQTQQDMSVNVMDPSMYGQVGGSGAGGGGGVGGGATGAGDGSSSSGVVGGAQVQVTGAQGMMMEQQQQQQIQQQQQQADSYISQKLQEHIMRSQAQQLRSRDGHVTQVQDHMTGDQVQVQQQQQESTGMMQQYQTSGGETHTADGSETTDAQPKLVKVVIVHEDDPTIERHPVMQKSKKMTIEIGIQCELGPETIRALIEEEKAMEIRGRKANTQGDDDDGCHTDEENPNDRTVQKYPCEIDNCGKAYIHRKDLIRHMKIRHGRSPLKLEPVTVETREKPFICPVGHCGRSYYHLKDLRRHQRLCHKVNLETRTTSVLKDNVEVDEDCKTQLRYPCDFPGCLRSYVHKKDLVRHKRLYHKDLATKPTIPIPVRYTESELKRIKQEVKMEIDRSIEKIRLDSTGSTVSNATASGGEDPPNSSLLVEPEAELSSLNSTIDPNSSNLPTSEQSAVNVSIPLSTSGTSAQFVLFIDPSAPTSSATLVPTSTQASQAVQQASTTALFTGSSPCILPTSEALSVQSISKALLSSVTASLPQGQAQLDSATSSLLKMATGEQVDHAMISSEVASILGALEQTHFRQQLQQQQLLQQQQQQQDGSVSEQQVLPTLTSLPADILSIASFVSTATTPVSPTPTASVVSAQSSKVSPVESGDAVSKPVTLPENSKTISVVESLASETTVAGDGELAESTVVAASLHQLFSANPSQEHSEVTTNTDGSC